MEETDLGSKYASMSLEDRAYAILVDLGMAGSVEQNIEEEIEEEIAVEPMQVVEPKEVLVEELAEEKQQTETSVEEVADQKGEESSKPNVEDSEEPQEVQSSSTTTTTSSGSRKGKWFRSVRNYFTSRKRRNDDLTSDSSTSVLPEKYLKARQQPKSPEEEAKLAAKYGAMSLEDRAFAILSDLGMIEFY